MPIVTDADIARPPADVFAYATDPARFGEWQAGVVGGHTEGEAPRSCQKLKQRLETAS